MRIGPITHDPHQLCAELVRVRTPVVLDTETTGLQTRTDRILSVGIRINQANHILFTHRCSHAGILPHKNPRRRATTSPGAPLPPRIGRRRSQPQVRPPHAPA